MKSSTIPIVAEIITTPSIAIILVSFVMIIETNNADIKPKIIADLQDMRQISFLLYDNLKLLFLTQFKNGINLFVAKYVITKAIITIPYSSNPKFILITFVSSSLIKY
ncbi:MAG: hypothetical protein Ct9H300mP24_8420 [Candidatus Neomarinimicrobiota bacterium]|nr:MAG: hypothetical protein Ct9H300mP24_8420 [Candidatus Neomarinimicrobiota bacterium]